MIRTELERTSQTFGSESKFVFGMMLATASCCVSAAVEHVQHVDRFSEVFRSTKVDLLQSTAQFVIDPCGQDYLQDYVETFSKALAQLDAGEVITVPADVQSEDEFFEWLKSV